MGIVGKFNKIKRAIACLIIKKKKSLNLKEPTITFTFDDVPNSAFDIAVPILKKYGYHATFYVSMGLVDKNRPDGGYFDPHVLKKIVDDDNELGCHTYNHIHLYDSCKDEVENDLAENQKQLEKFVPGYKFSNFSYPYGEQSFTSKLILKNKFKSSRGVITGINPNEVDLNNLKAVQLSNDSLKLEDAFGFIDKAIATNGWLIFFTHDTEARPSPWGCTPEYFESVVKYCFDKKIKVLTVEKVMREILKSA